MVFRSICDTAFLEVAQRQAIPQVPPNTKDDHVILEMASPEQSGSGPLHEFTVSNRLRRRCYRSDYFISMGEVLLPEVEISKTSSSAIMATVRVQWTFPLAFGEIVWGDGKETFSQTFDLTDTFPFGRETFKWSTEARSWQWARVAVWDVAGNGAFINPVRR
jgi:hypothetical protein